MIIKGYNIEDNINRNKQLNESLNEYGFNLNYKEKEDIFSSSIKSKKCLETKETLIKDK